jgi:hypothetical protein
MGATGTCRIKALTVCIQAGGSDPLETSVWDLLQRAEQANQRKRRIQAGNNWFGVRGTRAGHYFSDVQVEQALQTKNLMLLEAYRKAPDWFLIAEDPTTPGYLSLVYKIRPQMRFHFPSSMRHEFDLAALLG